MNKLRDGLPELPMSMSGRPIDERGYPVPWFVMKVGDKYDFRIIGPGKLARAVQFDLCWICGGKLGVNKTFLLGPMCSVTRITSEPPSHSICAGWAARVCPFLILPKAQYRAANLPDIPLNAPAGEFLNRNPGVCALWTTKEYSQFAVSNGVLFRVGEPLKVEWKSQGRDATRDEVLEAINSGLPHLRVEAERNGGAKDLQILGEEVELALKLLPQAA